MSSRPEPLRYARLWIVPLVQQCGSEFYNIALQRINHGDEDALREVMVKARKNLAWADDRLERAIADGKPAHWISAYRTERDQMRSPIREIERLCAEHGILLPPAEPGGCWRTRPEPTASAPDGDVARCG
jgi:hypothetical protein